MKKAKIVIVEDSQPLAEALKLHLEYQTSFPCEVVVLSPIRFRMPSFEEFHDEIAGHMEGEDTLLLLDEHLGKWRWKGSHLAPSFPRRVSISSEKLGHERFQFEYKKEFAFRSAQTEERLIKVVMEALNAYRPDLMFDIRQEQKNSSRS